MTNKINFDSQFYMNYKDYLKGIDLQNWYRYYYILKKVIKFKPKSVLEIGAGNEIVKNCSTKFIKNYKVMDINPKLKPDILSDLRKFNPKLKEKFNCVICADVLEHMPFNDLEKNLTNIFNYLTKDGRAIITIPHRRARIMLITPLSSQKVKIIELPSWLKSSPKSFFKQIIKRKIWIDPHHCWEIGDGKIKKADVSHIIKKAGFSIDNFTKLLYVDFWVLKKKK